MEVFWNHDGLPEILFKIQIYTYILYTQVLYLKQVKETL